MFNHILVPLDGSDLAAGVLPHVRAMAQAFNARVTLLVVAEAPEQGQVDVLDWHLRKNEAHTYLGTQADALRQFGLAVETDIMQGPAAERIVEYAHSRNTDLTILSSHGTGGVSEWNISHITQKVLQRGMTSTLLIHAARSTSSSVHENPYRRILVPLDGSRRAECVLPVANILAAREQTHLLLAHVTTPPFLFQRLPPSAEDNAYIQRLIDYNESQATKYLQEVAPRVSPTVETIQCVSDNVSLALHRMVSTEAIDLVIMSAHGHSAQSQWAHGSIVSNFIDNSPVPLLIVQDLPHALHNLPQSEAPQREALTSTEE